MQDAKQILNKVKEFFNELTTPASVDQAAAPAPTAPAMPMMTDYELMDGGMVSIDNLQVGGIVLIDGNPALPGDVQLKDGTTLTIGDNGVITTLQEPAEIETVPPMPGASEDMSAKFAAFTTATNEKFASYESKFAEYEAKLGKANKVIEELLKLSQLIVDAPAAQPDVTVKTANTFKEEKQKRSLDILFNN